MEKPKVGQTLYSLNVNNDARYKKQKLTPVTVKSVGRKYFVCGIDFCSDHMNRQYLLSTWWENTNYSRGSILYKTPKEWEDEKEGNEIRSYISDVFSGYAKSNNLNLYTLKKIKSIIDGEIDE